MWFIKLITNVFYFSAVRSVEALCRDEISRDPHKTPLKLRENACLGLEKSLARIGLTSSYR